MSKTAKILLVEDDSAIVDVYKTAFDAAGIGVEVMVWGKQAIERVGDIQQGKAEKPNLVLLDLILPDINGIEILEKIKTNETTKDIIVFVLSNYMNEKLGRDEGSKPDKFILKTSITPTELVKLIIKTCKKKF